MAKAVANLSEDLPIYYPRMRVVEEQKPVSIVRSVIRSDKVKITLYITMPSICTVNSISMFQ